MKLGTDTSAWGRITLFFIGGAVVLSGAAMWNGMQGTLAKQGFLPHGLCYTWNPSLIGLHVVSDTLIGIAYFTIPVTLVYFIQKRRDLPFNWMFLLFGLFIVACGTTHWMDVLTLWQPVYWASGVVKAITAAASVPTAIALALMIPQALAVPSTRDLAEAKGALELEVIERKRVEAELRQAQATLEARVAERTAALAAATDDARRAHQSLQEADERKDRFLAILSHELRNPLNPIRSAVAVLRQPNARPDQIAAARDVIDRQVGQMAHLLDDLLDISRIAQNRVSLNREPMEISAAVNAAVEATRPLFDDANQQLTVSLPVQPLLVDGDGTRLAQVLSNLLNNASKYTDAEGRISLAVSRENGEAVIRVSDNGAGIEPQHLGYVFELFSRIESQRNRTVGGLGIGLALVKSLVQMHGGSVSVTSAGSGRGSEFVVRLPLAPAKEAPSHPPAAEPGFAPANRMLRILVVDDNADSAESLAMLLQLIGHDVRKAGGASEALAIAENFHPDVGVFDIGMPEIDGYELARRVRGQAWGKTMRLIALTGWGKDEDKALSAQAGFDRHLIKPVDLAALDEELRLVEKSRGA
ncbi:MAG TPA: ATP-binding protein [Burkholderiales bacterium]|nr:ATP-binding protein [Burkholderiales bacterium]